MPMSLQLSKAVTDGLRRVPTATGVVLLVTTFLLQLTVLTSINTLLVAANPEAATALGPTLPVTGAAAGGLLAAAGLANLLFLVVVTRALARPLADLSSLPATLVTRRPFRATLTMLVTTVIVSVLTTVGFAFVILPGLYLTACFLFAFFVVSVEDRGVVGALRRTWALSSGNRLRLVVLVAINVFGGVTIGVVWTIARVAGAATAGAVLNAGLTAVLSTCVLAITASAYLQLAGGDRDADEVATPARRGVSPE
jgi:hypothetical protein